MADNKNPRVIGPGRPERNTHITSGLAILISKTDKMAIISMRLRIKRGNGTQFMLDKETYLFAQLKIITEYLALILKALLTSICV
jgi:hypothetical protein